MHCAPLHSTVIGRVSKHLIRWRLSSCDNNFSFEHAFNCDGDFLHSTEVYRLGTHSIGPGNSLYIGHPIDRYTVREGERIFCQVRPRRGIFCTLAHQSLPIGVWQKTCPATSVHKSSPRLLDNVLRQMVTFLEKQHKTNLSSKGDAMMPLCIPRLEQTQ